MDLWSFCIELIRVSKHFTNVSMELSGSLIVSGSKIVSNCSQINRLFNNGEISWNIKFYRINWFKEWPRAWMFFKLLKKLHARFHFWWYCLLEHVDTSWDNFILFLRNRWLGCSLSFKFWIKFLKVFFLHLSSRWCLFFIYKTFWIFTLRIIFQLFNRFRHRNERKTFR